MTALELAQAASSDVATVLSTLGTSRMGLTSSEALDRLRNHGPNAVRSHRARAIDVLVRQLKSPLLILLVAAALTSAVVGEHTDAAIIIAIMALSVVLGPSSCGTRDAPPLCYGERRHRPSAERAIRRPA